MNNATSNATNNASNSGKRMGALAASVLVATIAGGAGGAEGAIRRVKAGGFVLISDGNSWLTPFQTLGQAIAVSQPGDEIWVAAGTYNPGQSVQGGVVVGSSDRDRSFVMESGVALYGGFNGTEFFRDQRNPGTNVTVLSGDLTGTPATNDNSRTIVLAIGVDSGGILDGFTITGGYCSDGSSAVQDQTGMGAGMFISGGSPVIRNCKFVGNSARGGGAIGALFSSITVQNCSFTQGWGDSRGGGIDMWGCTNILVEDCHFEGNTAYYGGGIYGNNGTGGRIERCRFVDNLSVNGGGVSWAGFSNPIVRNCLFLKNRCDQISFFQHSFDGGAARNWCAGVTYVNCVFNGNWARGKGAAVYDAGPSGSTSVQINCTYVNNSSRDGGVVASVTPHVPVVKNSLMYDNPVTLTEGVVTLVNTASGLPHFVDADGADNLAATIDDDLRLASTSPYIDAGNNADLPAGTTTDFAGNPRISSQASPASPVVDLGAYEFTYVPDHCDGDANADRVVDFDDITTVLSRWLTSGPMGDADDNGTVDFDDITAVLSRWLQTCP
ncbi:MAG TPA: hypothetical protein DEB06_02990 [Phycisphaerales bacterium]|nr:hypothetical protein [Phycisphaerales bacterium]